MAAFLLDLLQNCRAATRLLERRAAGQLGLTGRLRLWIHLRGCVYCRRYARQAALIARALRATTTHVGHAALSADQKARLRRVVRAGRGGE